MITFSICSKPIIEKYWEYCVKHQIPHIEIFTIDAKYVNISYDLLPCLPFQKLRGELLDKVITLCEAYCDFYQLEEDKINHAGGSIAFVFDVKK